MKAHTPKNFVIQLGSLMALYVSLTALIILVFGIINIKFPDALEYYGTIESTRESMRWGIALLVVFFPTYLTLTRISNQSRRREEDGEYTALAKWLVYISLLAGGGVVLGDLVTILIYFLNGEISERFILKALALLVIVGTALTYYALDAKGHFKKNEKQSIQFGAGATLLVLIAVIVGFMNIETPAEVREMKLDDQQITDLQEVQFRTEEYYRVEGVLPTSISDLYDNQRVLEAPNSRPSYTYNIIDETNYELCATFLHESPENYYRDRSVAMPYGKDNYSWDHGVGLKCFKRTVEYLVAPTLQD